MVESYWSCPRRLSYCLGWQAAFLCRLVFCNDMAPVCDSVQICFLMGIGVQHGRNFRSVTFTLCAPAFFLGQHVGLSIKLCRPVLGNYAQPILLSLLDLWPLTFVQAANFVNVFVENHTGSTFWMSSTGIFVWPWNQDNLEISGYFVSTITLWTIFQGSLQCCVCFINS